MSVMSMSGDLQIDEACVGPPGTKVLFWLTGVGVLAAKVQSTIDEDIGIIRIQHCKRSSQLKARIDLTPLRVDSYGWNRAPRFVRADVSSTA